jgi:hypothetical protein
VSRNKNLGASAVDMLQSIRCILARIATDMCHQHLDALDLEEAKFAIHTPDNIAIDIAIYGTQRLKRGYLVGNLRSAKIACTPHLIARQ